MSRRRQNAQNMAICYIAAAEQKSDTTECDNLIVSNPDTRLIAQLDNYRAEGLCESGNGRLLIS